MQSTEKIKFYFHNFRVTLYSQIFKVFAHLIASSVLHFTEGDENIRWVIGPAAQKRQKKKKYKPILGIQTKLSAQSNKNWFILKRRYIYEGNRRYNSFPLRMGLSQLPSHLLPKSQIDSLSLPSQGVRIIYFIQSVNVFVVDFFLSVKCHLFRKLFLYDFTYPIFVYYSFTTRRQ